jgi:hypothetical protein
VCLFPFLCFFSIYSIDFFVALKLRRGGTRTNFFFPKQTQHKSRPTSYLRGLPHMIYGSKCTIFQITKKFKILTLDKVWISLQKAWSSTTGCKLFEKMDLVFLSGQQNMYSSCKYTPWSKGGPHNYLNSQSVL